MIYDFLEKYKTELELEKDKCCQELIDLNLKFKEAVYYLKYCESVTDENYKSFSPRKIVTDNDSKIEFYKKEIKQYKILIQEKNAELEFFNNKISSLIDYIKYENQKKVNLVINEELTNILEIQEDERSRIARDLHDTVIQNMTHMVHKIELSSKLVDIDPIRCKLELTKMETNIRSIISEMRKVIYNLHPTILDDIGIDVTIEYELDKLKEVGNLDIQYVVEGSVIKVKPIIGVTLLRIVQEACNNVIKHSKATIVKVILEFSTNYINVEIEDNGVGFDLNNDNSVEYNNKTGFGIKIMKERIYLLSGEFNIKSVLNKGTSINVKVPI